MLSELKRLHADLETFLDELERLTAESIVRPHEIANARLKLTRASRRRNKFLDTIIYPALMESSTASDARVQRLRDADKERLLISTNHISKWTLGEIVEHWSDYRAASFQLRAAMRDRIREEQAVLYPLLRE